MAGIVAGAPELPMWARSSLSGLYGLIVWTGEHPACFAAVTESRRSRVSSLVVVPPVFLLDTISTAASTATATPAATQPLRRRTTRRAIRRWICSRWRRASSLRWMRLGPPGEAGAGRTDVASVVVVARPWAGRV